VISLVGNPKTLQDFKDKVSSPTISAHLAHVHGYYHGGEAAEETLSATLEDVQRRKITFPNWDLLQISIRSAGIDQTRSSTNETLVETVLRKMLVNSINWEEEWNRLYSTVLTESITQQLRVVLLGPNTSSLRLPSLATKLSPNIEMTTNLSAQNRQPGRADDIAIVGMSVNFPLGDGAAEFWESLKNGINTVSEVCDSSYLLIWCRS
jgi:hypothetical protein